MAGRTRWWQPELALVLALPLATLAGGWWTLRAAAGDLSADGGAQGVRRTAQVQTAELAPDLAAARLGLSAELRIERAPGRVRVRLDGALPAAQALPTLVFLHPLRAAADHAAPLAGSARDAVAATAPAAGTRWRVVLADAGGRWRLVGTLAPGATRLRLRPAVAAP